MRSISSDRSSPDKSSRDSTTDRHVNEHWMVCRLEEMCRKCGMIDEKCHFSIVRRNMKSA